MLFLNSCRRDIDLTAWLDGGRFCGFTASATVEGLHFLLFFAVAEDCRCMGYGSAILKAIQAQHPAVVLNIELLDPAAPKPVLPVVRTLPEAYEMVCQQLSADFGTKVNINLKGKNNGVIEIPYIGKDELVRILQLFGINFPQ